MRLRETLPKEDENEEDEEEKKKNESKISIENPLSPLFVHTSQIVELILPF